MTRDAALKLMGLPSFATPDHAHSRFRALSKTLHPDAGGTVEGFQALQAAYEELLKTPEDAHKRSENLKKLRMCRNRLDCVRARVKMMDPADRRIPDMVKPLEDEERELMKLLGEPVT